MPVSPTPPRNKNWLLVKFREWHSWGGLLLSATILLVAITGILLNHKGAIFHRGEGKSGPSGLLTTGTDLQALPVSFASALSRARDHYGELPLEKVELKDEDGRLVYKVARGGGEEIRIDASTGTISSKYGMRLDTAGRDPSAIHWAKLVDDLHTGKLFGTAGTILIDLTSVTIIALTMTGIYLWAVPVLRKRRGRLRAAAPAVASNSPPSDRLAQLVARKAEAVQAAREAREIPA